MSRERRITSDNEAAVQQEPGLFELTPTPGQIPSQVASQGAGQIPAKSPGLMPGIEKRVAREPAIDDRSGHRRRLRDRFRNGGADAMPDYELLELVLFAAFPRVDTKPIAKRLLDRFGSFAEVVNAPRERLMEVEGVGERATDEIKLIQAAATRAMRSALVAKPVLSSWNQVLDYLKVAQAYQEREQFRILFLDKKNKLIADEVQGEGTVDHTPVYIREVVKRALELSASALILVHNHPSGDPTPSRADIDMTRLIVEASRPFGIAIHDHIIVGRNGHASLKALKVM